MTEKGPAGEEARVGCYGRMGVQPSPKKKIEWGGAYRTGDEKKKDLRQVTDEGRRERVWAEICAQRKEALTQGREKGAISWVTSLPRRRGNREDLFKRAEAELLLGLSKKRGSKSLKERGGWKWVDAGAEHFSIKRISCP